MSDAYFNSENSYDVFINNMEICHPEIPSEITLNCDDPIPTAIAPPVSDNCDSSPNVSINETTQQGDCNTNTVITRTWTATDACGNSSQFVQTINVLPDTEDPTFDTTPTALTIPCSDLSTTSTTVSVWLASVTASDGCDNDPVVSNDYVPGTINLCANTTTLVPWTATDECGLTSELT
mgnify:CR=1 FL=1